MHAEILANRIIQLGGTPVLQFDKLIATAKYGYKELPSDPILLI
jgi:bacterioferritin (cytochrome b1)